MKMGPLHGLKIVEIAGIGPTQFCGMLLADLGAEIIRIERPVDDDPVARIPPEFNLMNRSRPTITADLKSESGRALVLRLCEDAVALFEGFRPGVMERLGLGPEDCMARNPGLVFGRMTGWGQQGPLAKTAGHDANYIALSGALAAIGEKDGDPVYPLNLVGDFGGGGAYLALGLLAGILEASRSGNGQVVDAAMVDGASSLMTVFHGLAAAGLWREERGSNVLDGGAPFARPYRTADGKYIVIQPLENRFYRELLRLLGIHDLDPRSQHDPARWPAVHTRLEQAFLARTREEWCELLEGSDACFAPVLTMSEAAQHPHIRARKTLVELNGITQPAPAPRFSRTPGQVQQAAGGPEQAGPVLDKWGLSEKEIEALGL
jgi:alpha-methylacyl-CoA racemase